MNATAPAPTDRVAATAPRVTPNALRAFGGIWRLTFRRFLAPAQWLMLLVGVAIIALVLLSAVKVGRPRFYSEWTLAVYLMFLVPLLAFISGGGALRDEMKPGSVDYVLTRPVFRPAFVAFKFFSHLACIQVLYLFPLAAIYAIGLHRQIPTLNAAVPWLLFAQVLLVTAFTALGFLCAAITTRFLVLGLAYGGVVEIGIGNIPTQLSKLSLTQQVRGLLQPHLPGLPPLPASDVIPSLGSTLIFALGFAAIAIGVTAMIFSLQELAGAKARDA
jgi:ABC-2 type transport system permease protein